MLISIRRASSEATQRARPAVWLRLMCVKGFAATADGNGYWIIRVDSQGNGTFPPSATPLLMPTPFRLPRRCRQSRRVDRTSAMRPVWSRAERVSLATDNPGSQSRPASGASSPQDQQRSRPRCWRSHDVGRQLARRRSLAHARAADRSSWRLAAHEPMIR
jgi:hypothetical protein